MATLAGKASDFRGRPNAHGSQHLSSPLGLLDGKNGHHLFAYTVSTASSWKGPIDELEVVVDLPRGLISVLTFKPEGWMRKGRTLRWSRKEWEPTETDDIEVWFFPGIDIDNDGDPGDAWLWGDHAPRFERGTITISAQLLADCLTTAGTMVRVDPATKKEIEDTRPEVPGKFNINPKSGTGSLSYGTKVISFRSGSSVANCEGQAIRLTRSVSRPIRRLEFTGPASPKQWVYNVRVPVRIIEALGWRVHFDSENSTLHLIAPKEGDADKRKGQSLPLGRIAFERDRCLWLINADGSEQKRIAYGTSPSWSPSGRFLAFLHEGDIWTLDMQTGRKRQLTRDGRWVSVPAWSPDEKWLAGGREIHPALGDGGFYLIAVLDGRRTALIPPKQGEGAVLCPYTLATPQFSPDGRLIAFRDVGAKAYVIDTKQAGKRPVIPSEHSPLWVNGLAWLEDPPRLLFSCTREDESTEGVGIWIYDPKTNRSSLWAMQGKNAYHLAVSLGAETVAALQDDQKETNLWLISAADRKMRKVHTMPRQTSEVMDGIERICWSPDGSSLLVASGRAVSVVNLDSAGLSQLADRASHPDWWGPVQQAALELEPASALKEFAAFVSRGFTLEHLVRADLDGDGIHEAVLGIEGKEYDMGSNDTQGAPRVVVLKRRQSRWRKTWERLGDMVVLKRGKGRWRKTWEDSEFGYLHSLKVEDTNGDGRPDLAFVLVSHSRSASLPSYQFNFHLYSWRGGQLRSLLKKPLRWHYGGFMADDIDGKHRGKELVRWQSIGNDFYDESRRYTVEFYRWNGRQYERYRQMRTQRKYEIGDDEGILREARMPLDTSKNRQ